MQENENKKYSKNYCVCVCKREREREREGGREGERNNLSVTENYANNRRENNKFIEDDVNMKRQNKER